MHAISKEKYGFQLVFGGAVGLDEMKRWRDEAKAALVGAAKSFGVLIDMRTMQPISVQSPGGAETQAVMVEGQKLFKMAGMERSCVILNSGVVAMQFKRLARESGIYAFERYLDASTAPDWQAKAVAWIEKKIDPDA